MHAVEGCDPPPKCMSRSSIKDGPDEQFKFIPNSDEEGIDNRFSMEDGGEESEPKTELQDGGVVEEKGSGMRGGGSWLVRFGLVDSNKGEMQPATQLRFEFIPDSDEEGVDNRICTEDSNEEFVPETELQNGGALENKGDSEIGELMRGNVAGQFPVFIPFITSEEEVPSDKQDGGSQFVGVDLREQ
ncbi:hypothetical protein E2562_005676 [Oryza meyeriana var. granulata]|uniref:Uncharacterized protein n=1 Tax=Oryza meyeriana var. granulata TaxID=110450 RepID=A0A6G1F4A6_9ORYZ|nr:hypothetical protein E2562_005676 [Oryza meyeriana var. granulata]